jgi:thioredoxin-dependent peroxiredoxin
MATTQPSAAVRQAGDRAPGFSLDSTTGKRIKLSDLAGKTVILYFYPKADTPGCTREACGFRDAQAEYHKRDFVVLGISPDPLADIEKFADKYSLNFTLLADPDHAIAEKYGVWQKKKVAGRDYLGVARTTFIIGPDGMILHTFQNVKPDGHDQEVLEWLARGWSTATQTAASQHLGRSHTSH